MHRELRTTNEAFQPPKMAGLCLFTGLLLLLVGRDIWPDLAAFFNRQGLDLPTGSRLLFGFRYALYAAVIGGARVLYGSLESLFEGKLGADMALAVACIAAILIGEPLVAAEVVLVGLIGECLEGFTFARTQNAIRKLTELFPIRCWVLRDGQEVRAFVRDVVVGDVVVVKPGAKVPVDGIVREGRSAVDVSALTGESLPVDKGPGDEVLAGSLNQNGALTIESTRVQEQTVAGQVLELTAKALKDKAPVERQADRLARYFLPAVLAIATATFMANLIWYAGPLRGEALRLTLGQAARLSMYPALAVLVVACPCALILATPAAVIAALGRLAGTGVLLKSGAALERLAGVTNFAFDKTGTLTEGMLELGDVLLIDNSIPPEHLLRLAASAEQQSEHPLARLLVQEAQRRSLALDPVEEFIAHPGAGVRTRAGGKTMLVGTPRLLQEQGLPLTGEARSLIERLESDGQTPLLVAAEGRILGALGARDRIRPEAHGVIAELRELGVQHISLLTGDRQAVAAKVASELGIESVHAELLPADKAKLVTPLVGPASDMAARRSFAFVGDGVNDAPALASATVGLAVGGAAEVAAEAGDIVLMGDPLRPLPLLVRLSRQMVHIIRQNIVFFAFGVNIVGIVLTGWLWPLLARSPEWYERAPLAGVIYHQLGSLLVLLNSMRLLAFERKGMKASSGQVRKALEQLDTWVERASNADEWLHELSHRWKPIALGLGLITLVAYAASGLTQVEPNEIALVRRFGRPLEQDLGPGLHWRWPWPAETVLKTQPDQVRSVEVGFRVLKDRLPKTEGQQTRAALTWLSQHESEGVLRVEAEAVMPTGDGNLVELLATLQYRIRPPHRRYLLEVNDPDEILRAILEAVLREQAAGESFLELLTLRRADFQREVFARLQQRLKSYGDPGLGIALEGLALRDLHPPAPVVPAFHDVAKAAEEHDQKIKEAEAEALRIRREAESRGKEIERQAEAAAHRTVEMAKKDRDVFLAWHKLRTELSPAVESRLATETIGLILAGQDVTSALADHQRRRHEQLEIQAFLVDFRLTWMALAETLSQRDKVFIDADKLPGRRTLLLFGPDQLTPPPIILPSRMPARGPGGEGEER
ncbi:MAG TPA: cation-translocating P-type ATPase family protein [Gemmataceae bacterium]|jgi:Cu+-exporting ATPase|nr:cation-translocating P-type ATPase family protein [Gemmataceae bacterium]